MEKPTATITLPTEDWENILNVLQALADHYEREATVSEDKSFGEFLLYSAEDVRAVCNTIQDGLNQ